MVDVDDDLMAVARCRRLRAKRGVRDVHERLGMRPRRFRGTAPLPPDTALEDMQRPHEQRSVLGREPAADDHAAVVVDPGRKVGAEMERLGFIGRDATVRPHGPLQLRGGEAASQPE